MIITIWGASDDLVEIEGDCPGCDEYNTTSDHGHKIILQSGKDRMTIYVHYQGTWGFAVCQPNDIEWPITRSWGDKKEYSDTLYITVPDDTEVTFGN